jgi:hypothetical protein
MADYQGVYVLVEKVKAGPDRVAVAGMEPDDLQEPAITGGYVLKRDRFDANDQVLNTTRGVQLGIEDPKRSQIGTAQRTWIRTWLNQMETALYGANWRHPSRVTAVSSIRFSSTTTGSRGRRRTSTVTVSARSGSRTAAGGSRWGHLGLQPHFRQRQLPRRLAHQRLVLPQRR